ncbi:MAG: hypothetical protein V3U65_13570 [Granulosicoccaceae bacterium]
MYLANAHVYVLHTASGHVIYAGPTEFVSAIEVIDKPTVINEWLQVVGRYYPDPALDKEFNFFLKPRFRTTNSMATWLVQSFIAPLSGSSP